MPAHVRPSAIEGAAFITAASSTDDRGEFREILRCDSAAVQQVNCTRSVRGALRGISMTGVPPGQAKVVTCLAGTVLDVVVDLRAGSPSFGRWEMSRLDAGSLEAVYVPPGVGHCYLSLADESVVLYLLSQTHDPRHEHRVDPLDPRIGIEWPHGITPVLSPKDASAPGLEEALRTGVLPAWADCVPYIHVPVTRTPGMTKVRNP